MGIRNQPGRAFEIIYDSYFGMCIDRWGDTFIGLESKSLYEKEWNNRAITWWLVIRCDIEHSKRRPKDWFNPHYEPDAITGIPKLHWNGNGMAISRPRKLKNITAKNEYNKITKELWI